MCRARQGSGCFPVATPGCAPARCCRQRDGPHFAVSRLRLEERAGLGPGVGAPCVRLRRAPFGQTVTAQDWPCGLTQRHRGTLGLAPPTPRAAHRPALLPRAPQSVESSSRKGTAGGSMRLVPMSAEGSPRAAVGARGSEGPVSPRPAGCRPQRGQPGSCRGSSVGGRAPRPDVGASRGVAAVGGWRRQPGWAAA